jgi:hypothetical protein
LGSASYSTGRQKRELSPNAYRIPAWAMMSLPSSRTFS